MFKRGRLACVKGMSDRESGNKGGTATAVVPFWGAAVFYGAARKMLFFERIGYMSNQLKRPKGTQDVLPSEAAKWRTVEDAVREAAEQFGFREIRTPDFEETGLYVRSAGATSDVVTKEMYTVSSTGDSSFTLRPEGTAGVVRAMLENGLMNEGFPQKVYYLAQCYRHEKPQAGRYREFKQFGVEMFGTQSPYADAEIILLASTVLERCGLENVTLHINSIGCPECRAKYREALRSFFLPHVEELCPTCRERLDKNPMRLLDCKSPICQGIAAGAPLITDYLCDGCREHFDALKEILTEYGVEFTVDPKIVRGLDYYTKTVFEFISQDIGSQGTVCGGGRYDGLVSELGGQQVPALGFGLGLERLIMTMEAAGVEFEPAKTCDLYIAPMGAEAQKKSALLADAVRRAGYAAETDLVGRGIKPQMRYADKIKAKFVCVIGDNELSCGEAKLKNMATGEETPVKLEEFMTGFSNLMLNEIFDGELGETIGRLVEGLEPAEEQPEG